MPREIDNHTERTLMNGVVFAMTQIASSTHRKHLGLKGRYSLIITLFMGLGLLVIAGTVLSRILHLGNDQVYTLLNTHMQMVASQIDGTFYEAAGLAQQMSPEGPVGKKYYEYITAETHFDRIARSHTLSDDMSNILFSHRKASLVGYLGPAGSSGRRVTEFMTFPLHANAPDIDTLPTLLTVNGMCFHAIHGSVSALNAKPSISVSKEAHFPGRKRKAYVEFYLDVSDSLRIDSIGREYTCILAVLDPAGNTVYATSPDVALGEPLAGQPVLDDVYHVSQKSAFGFSYALMVMRSTYWQYVLAWMRDLIVVLALTAAIVAGTVTLLYRLIYKPIRLFAEEVETICDGDLTPSSQSFGIREFDELFTKIEEMKRAITMLMDNARYAEKEKRHLQLDNLYYQINPHFLLNALNSLHWLAMMSNQQDIVQYVHQLNSILSYSLGKTTGIITLRTELRVADDYVKLQQMRYDFNFSMDVEEGAYLDTPCARLILQPVLENAICHNMNEFGSLLLEVHPHDDGHVCIRIRDDGAGMKTLPSEGLLLRDVSDSGIGFKYLQGTLDAYYGQAANVLIRPGSEGGVCVEMLLPLL